MSSAEWHAIGKYDALRIRILYAIIRALQLFDHIPSGSPFSTLVKPAKNNPRWDSEVGELHPIQVAVQNNHLTFPGNTKVASYQNLNRYSYHVYGGTGFFYGQIYTGLKAQVCAITLNNEKCCHITELGLVKGVQDPWPPTLYTMLPKL